MSVNDILKELEYKIKDLEHTARKTGQNFESVLSPLKEELQKIRSDKQQDVSNNERWQRVLLARHPDRPTAHDYIEILTKNFMELHGDRLYGDDPALIGGLATWEGEPIVLLAQQKGRTTKSKIKRRFGMSNPEGYRKAMRLMDLADKFSLPVVALIDTPGAYPGIEAEERGQGWAIAESIRRMSRLKVPAISVILSEGGSGGALAIGTANRVLILENAWYSVISPEACASIIWKDATKAPQAAQALRLTATDLKEFGIVEEVIKEPNGGAHLDKVSVAYNLGETVSRHLRELKTMSEAELLDQRAKRFRIMGAFANKKNNQVY